MRSPEQWRTDPTGCSAGESSWRSTTSWGHWKWNLFGSRLSTQLPTFVNWRPDPEVMATDAFTISWSVLKAYTPQPTMESGRQGPSPSSTAGSGPDPGYPSVEISTIVPSTAGEVHRLSQTAFSGKVAKSSSFRKKLQNSCSYHGEKNPQTTPKVGWLVWYKGYQSHFLPYRVCYINSLLAW